MSRRAPWECRAEGKGFGLVGVGVPVGRLGVFFSLKFGFCLLIIFLFSLSLCVSVAI